MMIKQKTDDYEKSDATHTSRSLMSSSRHLCRARRLRSDIVTVSTLVTLRVGIPVSSQSNNYFPLSVSSCFKVLVQNILATGELA